MTNYYVKRYNSDRDFMANITSDMNTHTVVGVCCHGNQFYLVYE